VPVASPIVNAVHAFNRNAAMLSKSLDGLSPEEWTRRPCPTSNPVLWITGHLVWARSRALAILGEEWSRPWLPLFARGASLADDAGYPSHEEVLAGWHEVSGRLTAALESAPVDRLTAAAPEKSPSFDGTIAGYVAFMAFHETYHVGQAAYLRCWMGHSRVVG